jgi:hypothetical protein
MNESNQDLAEAVSDQPVATPVELKGQAQAYRQSATARSKEFYERPLAGWKQLLYLTLVFGSLFSVVFLLVVDERRQQLIALAGEVLNPGEQRDINRLPPPPPKVIQARVVTAEGTGSPVPGPEEPRGVLFLDQDPVRIRSGEVEPPAPIEFPRTESNRAAYELLVRLSDVAAQLSQNGFEELEFSTWRPARNEPPEFWIDLVAVRQADGEEVHLIWSVNTESERVSALSQAARDLETGR